MSTVRLKRIYDPPEKADGARVLIDRLWPRGLPRATATIFFAAHDVEHNNAMVVALRSGKRRKVFLLLFLQKKKSPSF